MINRGVSKTSQYFFNSKTGMLEKIDKNVQTIESLSKQAGLSLDDIGKKVNENTSNKPINNITVITAEDNLIHNYFTSMDVSWDASNCLSTAIIKAPKMDTENTNYWTTYTGQLTIYAGYNFVFDYVNNNSNPTEQDAANSLVKYWDNSGIKPFFRGEISRVKEFNNDIVIYVDSIGIRFQQKMPDDFRQAYIYNQNVRDAFQAICEFLGVKYICPPKTATDDGEEVAEDEQASTDGTENDVSQQQNKTQQMQQTAINKVNQSNNSSNNQPSSDPNAQTNTEGTEGEEGAEGEALTNNEEIEAPQNGYGDINFDANGAIVHGSKIIETSPDMAETLIAMEENPLEKYLEDETGIVESVQKLLDGEMFDELHNKVMDYGAITVEPKASSSSEMSTTGTGTTGTTGDTNSNGSNGSGSNGSGSSSGSGGTTARGVGYVHRVTPQPTARAIAGHRAPTVEEKVTSRAKNPFQAISQLIWRR